MNKIPSLKLCFPIILFLTFIFSGFAQDSNKTEKDTINIENVADDQTVAIEEEAETATLDTGNTAWMITATALVLFMTLPGLALFYGGLAQSKNVLSVLMQCFAIACLASLLWVVCGYSLSLTPGENEWLGGTSAFFLETLRL